MRVRVREVRGSVDLKVTRTSLRYKLKIKIPSAHNRNLSTQKTHIFKKVAKLNTQQNDKSKSTPINTQYTYCLLKAGKYTISFIVSNKIKNLKICTL